jgi:hypothetical protein
MGVHDQADQRSDEVRPPAIVEKEIKMRINNTQKQVNCAKKRCEFGILRISFGYEVNKEGLSLEDESHFRIIVRGVLGTTQKAVNGLTERVDEPHIIHSTEPSNTQLFEAMPLIYRSARINDPTPRVLGQAIRLPANW